MSMFYGYTGANDEATTMKQYVDDELAKVLPLTGGTMKGDLNIDLNSLKGLAVPVNDQDAVSKIYADDRYQKKGKADKFSRIWEYVGLTRTFNYPRNPSSGYPVTSMICTPTEHTELRIVGIFTDNDLRGLTSADTLEFELNYVLEDGTNKKATIFTADLSLYNKLSI